MKRNINKLLLASLALMATATSLTSCKNGNQEFPDYEGGTTVYFAYQQPVRTIVLGDDEYDTTLDKAHKCKILATFGGSYNGTNGSVQVSVDPTLVQNLTFEDGTPVKAMPENYYQLQTTNWSFNGTMNGGSEVQLTDAFFNDPDAVKNTYVIPLVISSQTGFGKILTGELKEGGSPVRTDESQWDVLPKDYVLYCVKYQNKYHGYWLTNGSTSIDDIEKAPARFIQTRSMTSAVYHASYTTKDYVQYKRDKDGNKTSETEKVSKTWNIDLLLTFDGSDHCTITPITAGITASGTGSWTDNGATKSWGNKDRDLMELTYNIDFNETDEVGNAQKAAVSEKLVWQRSGVTIEEFKSVYKK